VALGYSAGGLTLYRNTRSDALRCRASGHTGGRRGSLVPVQMQSGSHWAHVAQNLQLCTWLLC